MPRRGFAKVGSMFDVPACIRTTSFSFPVLLKFPKKPGQRFRVRWLAIAAKISGTCTGRFIQSFRRYSAQTSRYFFPRPLRGASWKHRSGIWSIAASFAACAARSRTNGSMWQSDAVKTPNRFKWNGGSMSSPRISIGNWLPENSIQSH